jgi:6-phosphogluconolactonase (cycloisomerase 2 family)
MQLSRPFFRATLVAGALIVSSALGASAHELDQSDGGSRAVFVQTNDPAGNQVLAYHRAHNGTLTLTGTYDAGGKGGRVEGAAVDPLASQGSLAYDREHQLLIGVNAGSDSVYAFEVDGDRLSSRIVVGSGGTLPVSVAVHGDLAYVLNAGGAGNVHGYRIDDNRLQSIAGSDRSLGLTPVTGPKAFLNTPGQVGFTPDGDQLIVTTKANGSKIDVFAVGDDGKLSAKPVANASATPVPFGFVFDARRHLVVGEAGASSVSTYTVHADGSLTTIASVPDGQAALCWIASAHGFDYVANAASGTVSGYRIDSSGHPTVIGATPVGAGPVDLAASRGGAFLYVQLGGAGQVNELKVNADGSLTSVGTVNTNANQEGIVAI